MPDVIPKSLATYITLSWTPAGRYKLGEDEKPGWSARLSWSSCQSGMADDLVEGEVVTRYYQCGPDGIRRAVQLVIDQAEAMGIHVARGGTFDSTTLGVRGDGESVAHPLPRGWRALVTKIAREFNLHCMY